MTESKPKPVISDEAKERIRNFVGAVAAAQLAHGVALTAEDGTLVLYDTKRTDQWIQDDGTSYGEWDAFLYGEDDSYPDTCIKSLSFEDFDGWNK